MSTLDGLVALVTGAARGIGAAIADRLAAEGAVVAKADLSDTGEPMHRVDIRSRESCRALVDEVRAKHGGIDILVNNAGVNARGPAETMPEESWLETLDVNLSGTFRMSQAVYPALAESAAPSIVNLTSTAAQIAVPGCVGYAVSKAGILHLTKVLALEWSGAGIRVNAVGPTIVPTAMNADVRADDAYLAGKLASIPLGRMVEPHEVADSVAFLASPAAKMITGHTIFVDGGVVIG